MVVPAVEIVVKTSATPRNSSLKTQTTATFAGRGERSEIGGTGKYLPRSHGSVRDAFPNADLDGQCPFAYDMQQPMRNLAIAKGLEQEDMVEKAWFALCAHDDNPDIFRHWVDWKNLLPDPSMAPYLPASEVINIGEADGLKGWATYMRDRYRLGDSS